MIDLTRELPESIPPEVRQDHAIEFYRRQFETESDLRDTLQEFILASTPHFEWKELCRCSTRALAGLFNCSLEDDEH